MDFKPNSHEDQIVKLNVRIKKLTEHLKIYEKDYATKTSLFKLVAKKKRFLKYLKNNKPESYEFFQKKPSN